MLICGALVVLSTLSSLAQAPSDLDAFFRAVTDGRNDKVTALLEKHPDWKEAELYLGIRPLYRAAVLGRDDVVKSLLAAGASPAVATDRGSLPLHAAAQHGHLEITQMLVAAQADLNAGNEDGQTALHLAARFKKADIVNALLAKGAKATVTDKWGRTALHYAAGLGQPGLVKVLVEAGADLDAVDHEGYSPLGLARTWKRNSFGDVGGYLEGKGATDIRPTAPAKE